MSMAISNSYVSLPEGIPNFFGQFSVNQQKGILVAQRRRATATSPTTRTRPTPRRPPPVAWPKKWLLFYGGKTAVSN